MEEIAALFVKLDAKIKVQSNGKADLSDVLRKAQELSAYNTGKKTTLRDLRTAVGSLLSTVETK